MLDRIEPGSYFNAFNASGERKAKETDKQRADRARSTDHSTATDVTGGASTSAETSFASTASAAELHEAQALLDEIHTLGAGLKRNPTVANLKEYRQLVQRFMNQVVAGAYSLDHRESGAAILKRKRFSLVSLVNQKLDRLAAGLIQTQEPQLDLLEQIEEIYGLLVDLMQ